MTGRKTVLFLLSLLLLGCVSASYGDTEKAPDFNLLTIEGEKVKLKDLLGKGPILIDFWATWCKPCIKYLPKLQDLYKEYGEKGFMVLAINEDGPRNLSKVKPFVNSLGLQFPILLDKNSQVLRRFRGFGIPISVLVNPEGEIVRVHRGYRPGDEKMWVEEIEKHLIVKEPKAQIQ
ncbi:MAG: redoxin domain-containing protein [Gemmatimonadota bacterium]|nr:MAG: redoxin domain-containing protein [Gemmatimonadota bacterium]